jgi:hypothetical protein
MADPTIQDLKDQIAHSTLVAPSQEHTHLGVPNDYQPPRNADLYGGVVDTPGMRPWSESMAGMVRGTVRYKPGDELKPLNTPQLVPQLQAQLVQAGLVDIKSIRIGVWDSTSQTAYRKVLGIANQMGIPAQDALQMLIGNPTLKQLQGSRAANVIQETNPLDIAATAQATAQKLLGRNLTDEELKPFVAQVQSQERTADTKTYKLGGQDGKGGVVVSAPTAESGYGAEDYYKKNYLPEVVGYAAVQRMNDFYSLLGGNG